MGSSTDPGLWDGPVASRAALAKSKSDGIRVRGQMRASYRWVARHRVRQCSGSRFRSRPLEPPVWTPTVRTRPGSHSVYTCTRRPPIDATPTCIYGYIRVPHVYRYAQARSGDTDVPDPPPGSRERGKIRHPDRPPATSRNAKTTLSPISAPATTRRLSVVISKVALGAFQCSVAGRSNKLSSQTLRQPLPTDEAP